MRVRAIAVATPRSNAVGMVELECTPHGLCIAYFGVGAFSEGYAPGALTSGTQVLVPWPNVLEARVDGDQVFIAVEPTTTPHHRLTLTNFSTGEVVPFRELGRQRLVVRVGAIGGAAVLALLSAVGVSRMTSTLGAVAAIAIGLLAAAAVLAIGFAAEQRLGLVTMSSDAARQAFVATLTGFMPQVPVSAAAPAEAPKPFVLPSLTGVLPRTTLAIVITLTAATLGALLTGKYVLSQQAENTAWVEQQRPPHDDEPATPLVRAAAPAATAARTRVAPTRASAAQAPAASAGDEADVARVTDRCICHRSDSLLWAEPIPRLSLLIVAQKRRQAARRPELEVEIAAINNSDRELKELALLVQFFDEAADAGAARSSSANRPLYFEGPLAPGAAIKWAVEAPGREFELENPVPGDVGPGTDHAAPADAVAALLDANHRPVRLHGAMLLAYLGDPRAREAALKLKEALRDEEIPYLERIVQAASDVRVCDLELSGTGSARRLLACVYNASAQAKSELGLRVRTLDQRVNPADPTGPPPNVLGEHSFKLPGALEPEMGVRARVTVQLPEGAPNPPVLEAYADRFDLLR